MPVPLSLTSKVCSSNTIGIIANRGQDRGWHPMMARSKQAFEEPRMECHTSGQTLLKAQRLVREWYRRKTISVSWPNRSSRSEPQLQGDAIPWHGAMPFNDRGFNAIDVARSQVAEDTRFPRISHDTVPGSAGLSLVPGEYWQIGRGTSWHFGVEFTGSGPVAFGLLSYSQSTDERSPYFSDQSQRYSQKDYRPLSFTEADIAENLLPGGETVVEGISLFNQQLD